MLPPPSVFSVPQFIPNLNSATIKRRAFSGFFTMTRRSEPYTSFTSEGTLSGDDMEASAFSAANYERRNRELH
jgi:hypothetical protein